MPDADPSIPIGPGDLAPAGADGAIFEGGGDLAPSSPGATVAIGAGDLAPAAPVPGTGYHPQTINYVGGVTAGGGSVSNALLMALDDFFNKEWLSGNYGDLSLYLSIWGVAAANGVNMRNGLPEMNFTGVTHAAGYSQGNGTTAYGDFEAAVPVPRPTTIGMTPGSAYVAVLAKTLGTAGATLLGSHISLDSRTTMSHTSGGDGSFSHSSGSGANATNIDLPGPGIISGSRVNGISLVAHRDTSNGRTITSATKADNGTLSGAKFAVFAYGTNGTPSSFSNAQLGAWAFGPVGLTAEEDERFTADLQTLWEACTGLSLP